MSAAAGSPALASFGIRETSLCKSCTQCGFLSNNFSDFRDNCSGDPGGASDRRWAAWTKFPNQTDLLAGNCNERVALKAPVGIEIGGPKAPRLLPICVRETISHMNMWKYRAIMSHSQ